MEGKCRYLDRGMCSVKAKVITKGPDGRLAECEKCHKRKEERNGKLH